VSSIPEDKSARTTPVVTPATGGVQPRRSQAQRTAESDARMLRAALKLIGERGYRGTSLAAIGQLAGYSRGLVNERFGSKAGLLWVLVKNMLRVWHREGRTRGEAGHTGIAELFAMLDNHRRAMERDEGIRAFYALMFEALGPLPELGPEFQELHRAFRADIEKILRAGIVAHTIRADIDPPSQSALMLGTMRGIAFQYLLDRQGFSLEAAYEELKRNLQRSLAP
jgi:AcrR family transcriptional regulator